MSPLHYCCALLLATTACTSEPAPLDRVQEIADLSPVLFADMTTTAGIDFSMRSGGRIKNYIVESKGGGGAFFDYDGDGWLDVYLVNGSRFAAYPDSVAPPGNALYRNIGDGTFQERTQTAGVGDTGWGMGVAVADYDNDNDADLYVSNYGANILYRNDGDGRFADVGKAAGVDLAGWSTSATFADYDNDGDLDFYVAQYLDFAPERAPPRGGMWKGVLVFAGPLGLPGAQDALYRNEGDGTFIDMTRKAKVGRAKPTYGLGALFCDYDRDGDPDLYVANDSAPNFLYRNQGNGAFAEVAVESGVALSAEGIAQAGMGIAYGDYDADGFSDFFVTHFEDDYNTLYRNRGDGSFGVTSADAGLTEPSLPRLAFGTNFLDYDNDRDLDLFVANGHVYPQIRHINPTGYSEANQLFANQGPDGGHRFAEVAAGDLNHANVSRGSAKGDYDNDGDIDLLVCNLDAHPALLRNDGGNQRHWLSLRLLGTASNRDGIGAIITIITDGVEQQIEHTNGGSFLSHSDARVHFGLGFSETVDALEIRWPSGRLQRLENIPADQFLLIEEPLP